jgi:hypothetical protein
MKVSEVILRAAEVLPADILEKRASTPPKYILQNDSVGKTPADASQDWLSGSPQVMIAIVLSL